MNNGISDLAHFWNLSSEDLSRSLKTDLSQGINPSEASARIKTFGLNSLEAKKKRRPDYHFSKPI